MLSSGSLVEFIRTKFKYFETVFGCKTETRILTVFHSRFITKIGIALVVTCLGCGYSYNDAQGQQRWQVKSNTSVSIGISGNLPFWFHSNQFGLYDSRGSNLLQSVDVRKEMDESRVIAYGVGANIVGRLSPDSKAFVHELFGEAKVGFLRLFAGKKGWRDRVWSSDLSLGSMIWSGNAPTMPRVMLEVPDYTYIPYTNDFIAFRGYFGHGWFGDDRFVQGTYLHEKALYLRFLPEAFPVNGHIGLIHNVQWGGNHPAQGTLPNGFNDYLRIISGQAGEADTSPGGEVINALGNTVGAYEARLDIDINNLEIKAYRQFFIETSVSTRLRSPWDGLWGLNITSEKYAGNLIKSVLYEHVNTMKQNSKPGETIGADQYFHNFIYRNGWSYKSRILGLPLVSLGPVNGREEVVNNIILAHHFGISGQLPVFIFDIPLQYQFKTTYSRSYGRTSNCSGDFCDENDPNPLRTPRQDQWYFHLQFSNRISSQISINSAVGFDSGDLSDEFGFFIGFSYSLLD